MIAKTKHFSNGWSIGCMAEWLLPTFELGLSVRVSSDHGWLAFNLGFVSMQISYDYIDPSLISE